MSNVTDQLKKSLANTYALYLKTQNYHWNVTGPHFSTLHELFEAFYKDLAENVDEIAERLVILGERAPGSFKEYAPLLTIEEAEGVMSAEEMLKDLHASFVSVLALLKEALERADDADDAGTEDLLTGLISSYEKKIWMLRAHFG